MVIGFISSLIGGIVAMGLVGFSIGIFIILGMVPHFFCGATAGIYGNATGGRRGAIIGAFVQGIAITVLPVMLIGVLGNLGFENTTFGDFDFAALGIVIGESTRFMGRMGAVLVLAAMLIPAIALSVGKHKNPTINFNEEE